MCPPQSCTIVGVVVRQTYLAYNDALSLEEYLQFQYAEVCFVDPWDSRVETNELIPGGDDVQVTLSNIRHYSSLLHERYLGPGVQQQVHAFQQGVGDFLSLDCLKIFTPAELSQLLVGDDFVWTKASLRRTLKLRGFEWSSPTVRFLIAELLAMDSTRRRKFLQFVTSSPTVPGAGFQIEVTNFGDAPVIRVHTCMNNGGILHLPEVRACVLPAPVICFHTTA